METVAEVSKTHEPSRYVLSVEGEVPGSVKMSDFVTLMENIDNDSQKRSSEIAHAEEEEYTNTVEEPNFGGEEYAYESDTDDWNEILNERNNDGKNQLVTNHVEQQPMNTDDALKYNYKKQVNQSTSIEAKNHSALHFTPNRGAELDMARQPEIKTPIINTKPSVVIKEKKPATKGHAVVSAQPNVHVLQTRNYEDQKQTFKEKPREITKKSYKTPIVDDLPFRLRDQKAIAESNSMVADSQRVKCPKCQTQVYRDQNMVWFNCGHHMHLTCHSSMEENLDGCIVCASENYKKNGYVEKMFDDIEEAIDHITIPDINNTSFHPVSGHDLTPFAALYNLTVSETKKANGKVPVVFDELSKQVAHAYGASESCSEPKNPLPEKAHGENPSESSTLTRIVSNLTSFSRSLTGFAGQGSETFVNSKLYTKGLLEALSKQKDVEDIMKKGYTIRDVIACKVNLQQLLDLGYTPYQLKKMHATRDHLLELGMTCDDLKTMRLDYLEKEYFIDQKFVYEKMLNKNWINIIRTQMSPRVMQFYGFNCMWLSKTGINPLHWKQLNYLSPTDFRDYLGMNEAFFNDYHQVATYIVDQMGWSNNVLRQVFGVQIVSDESNNSMQNQTHSVANNGVEYSRNNNVASDPSMMSPIDSHMNNGVYAQKSREVNYHSDTALISKHPHAQVTRPRHVTYSADQSNALSRLPNNYSSRQNYDGVDYYGMGSTQLNRPVDNNTYANSNGDYYPMQPCAPIPSVQNQTQPPIHYPTHQIGDYHSPTNGMYGGNAVSAPVNNVNYMHNNMSPY